MSRQEVRRAARRADRPVVRLLVLAKEPVAGRVKTRLTPDFTAGEAAGLALAALEDTLDTVALAAERLARHGIEAETVLVLDGRPWSELGRRWRIVQQRGDGLDERLDAAFSDAAFSDAAFADAGDEHGHAPAVLVGMDTPQLSADLLVDAAVLVAARGGADACLGPARDGGWWLLGLRRPYPGLLLGLPMSVPSTGSATLERLHDAGLTVAPLPVLRDVDTAADAALVAAQLPPGSRFSRLYDQLTRVAS